MSKPTVPERGRVKLTRCQASEIEDELRALEADPKTTVTAMRLFMQAPMPCGHATGNLLTCSEPPYGCVVCGDADATPPSAPATPRCEHGANPAKCLQCAGAVTKLPAPSTPPCGQIFESALVGAIICTKPKDHWRVGDIVMRSHSNGRSSWPAYEDGPPILLRNACDESNAVIPDTTDDTKRA